MATRLTVRITERDLGWEGLLRTTAQINGATVAAGFVGDKARQVHKDSDLTNAEIGIIHEFGAPGAHIPERSFIRSTFDRNKEKYDRETLLLAIAVYSGRAKIKSALDLIGSQMVSDQKATIRAGIPPPLAQSTIDRRSKRKKDREIPLLDTREMINALSHVVSIPDAAKSFTAANAAMRAAGEYRWSASGLQGFSDSFAAPDLGAFALR
jgi:hypothetical protein